MNKWYLTFWRSSCSLKSISCSSRLTLVVYSLSSSAFFLLSRDLSSALYCLQDPRVQRFNFPGELNVFWCHLRFLQHFLCRYQCWQNLPTALSVHLQCSTPRWDQATRKGWVCIWTITSLLLRHGSLLSIRKTGILCVFSIMVPFPVSHGNHWIHSRLEGHGVGKRQWIGLVVFWLEMSLVENIFS